jgi:CubicO group peptidase (beta-lactamase class C family)
MQEHIWKSLGTDSTTFWVTDRPDIAARLPQVIARSPSGTLTDSSAFTEPWKCVIRDMGGGGMYTSAGDYLKLLMAILRNDGTLLSKTSTAELLEPQVKDSECLVDERNTQMLAETWPKAGKVKCNHSLGGLVVIEDLSTERKRGSLMWFGSSMIV